MKATHQATALKSDGTRVNSYKLVYAHWPEEQLKILSRENSLSKPPSVFEVTHAVQETQFTLINTGDKLHVDQA